MSCKLCGSAESKRYPINIFRPEQYIKWFEWAPKYNAYTQKIHVIICEGCVNKNNPILNQCTSNIDTCVGTGIVSVAKEHFYYLCA